MDVQTVNILVNSVTVTDLNFVGILIFKTLERKMDIGFYGARETGGSERRRRGERVTDRQRQRDGDRETDRHSERQTDRQTEKKKKVMMMMMMMIFFR